MWEHRNHIKPNSFTSRYNLSVLVWYEDFPDINAAIECESRIKGWTRAKKIALIEKMNPKWEDLSAAFDQLPTINDPMEIDEPTDEE